VGSDDLLGNFAAAGHTRQKAGPSTLKTPSPRDHMGDDRLWPWRLL